MKFFKLTILVVILAAFWLSFHLITNQIENRQLKEMLKRLKADSRIAQIIVTKVNHDPLDNKTYTTIKFLEYDTQLNPLEPKYFTFSQNIIQFQSLVIRFDDFYVKRGHSLKGKSAYLFLKAFGLNQNGAEIYQINPVNEIPLGYSTGLAENRFEKNLWRKFWQYALNPEKAAQVGIKSAQIEAPGTKFIPGINYTLKIEHGGGLRIDAEPIPLIFQGEKILF